MGELKEIEKRGINGLKNCPTMNDVNVELKAKILETFYVFVLNSDPDNKDRTISGIIFREEL